MTRISTRFLTRKRVTGIDITRYIGTRIRAGKDFFFLFNKGQLISKANCQVVNSSKKRTNEFVFTTMWRVFVRFWKKLKTHKKTFCNQLTFSKRSIVFLLSLFSRISSSSSSLSLFALFYLAHFVWQIVKGAGVKRDICRQNSLGSSSREITCIYEQHILQMASTWHHLNVV